MCFFAGGTRFSEQGFGISACSEPACSVPFNSRYTLLGSSQVPFN
jgi:hypothetical protein